MRSLPVHLGVGTASRSSGQQYNCSFIMGTIWLRFPGIGTTLPVQPKLRVQLPPPPLRLRSRRRRASPCPPSPYCLLLRYREYSVKTDLFQASQQGRPASPASQYIPAFRPGHSTLAGGLLLAPLLIFFLAPCRMHGEVSRPRL